MPTRTVSRSFICSALLLAGCSERLSGADVIGSDRYCVPKSLKVSAVWFVPHSSTISEEGFSFGGCHRMPEAEREECGLPAALISTDVYPSQDAVRTSWNELRKSVNFQTYLKPPNPSIKHDESRGIVVLSNSGAVKSWTVWARTELNSQAGMADTDELLAICTHRYHFAGGTDGAASSGPFVCTRYVKRASYAIDYHFMSDEAVPSLEVMDALDDSILHQIELWRCPKIG